MIKAPERIEIPEEDDLRRERFARILAVLIVIATLGVASVEFLHSIAEKNADSAGVEAQRLSIQRQGETVRAGDIARANVDVYAYAEQQRTQQANAFQEYLAPSVQQGSAQAKLLQDEETRWSQLAALTGDLTSVKINGPTSPQSDANFPNALLAEAQKNSDKLFGQLDASNQLRSDWQGRIGLLSVILTMLAVAIYLFGLSLTLQARIRRWLVGLGVVLVVTGGVATIGLQFFNPTAPPEAAADSYSEGMYALSTFYTHPGDEGLKEADAAFTKAIQERPRFAQAYLERSIVRFLLGAPVRNTAIASVTTQAALQQQGDDLQQAFSLGLNNKLLLNNLAANRLLQAMYQNRSDYYSAALKYLNSALLLDPKDPLLYYNKGIAYLAQGNSSQAQDAYSQAVAHTLYTDVDAKTLRNDPFAQEQYVAGALTPLDLLAAHRSDLSSQVNSLKELIVNGVDRKQAAPGSGKATVSNLKLDVFAGELQWTGELNNFSSTSDAVSTEWYYQDPQQLGWTVIPSISGPQVAKVDNNSSAANAYYVIRRYLQATNQCLQPGKYRVELYISGHLVGQATSDGTQPSLQAQVMPDLALDFCQPADWKQDQANFLRGFSNGFTTKDSSAGAYFLRFQNPQLSGTNSTVEAQAFRDEVLQLAQSQGMLPTGSGAPTIDCGTSTNGTNTLPFGPSLNADCTRQQAYFLGLNGANEAWYNYNGGIMHIGTGIAADGAVIAAFTFGPTSQWQSSSEPAPDVMFDSIVSTQ